MIAKLQKSTLVLVFITLITGCSAQKQPSLLIPEIPQENAPLIDGTLSPGEWDTALQESFADGSQLSLLVSGGTLYLNIHDQPLDVIIGNVYINRGDEIAILHASAALGSAIYKKTGEEWTMTKDFIWSCRDSSNSEAARTEREVFLQQERWIASIAGMGNIDGLEYQIDLSGASMQMAITIHKESDPSMRFTWPAGTQDDPLEQFVSDFPTSLTFYPEGWAKITLTPDGKVYLEMPE
jgi:hypothetical protein